MNSTAPRNRLIGGLPKVGLRPVIDGRRQGVRESLENQTMAMARAVAGLLTSQVKHPCGLPVECVIADTCIGGFAESAQCAEKFAREGVGLTITVTPCWCYGAETIDMDPHTPKAIWGLNGTERPGAVYLAAALAAHNQKRRPAFSIYGRDVQDSNDGSIPADVQEKLLAFTRAGLAVATMRRKTYLSIGGTSMGIAGSIVDHSFFEQYLDMRVMPVDMCEMVRRIDEKIYDQAEFEKALAWVKANCAEGADHNPDHLKLDRAGLDRVWDISVKMALAARDMMIGNPALNEAWGEEALGFNALLGGFQGQRQWTDHFPNGDFMEAILNSSFDWNGIRQPFIMATENDSLNGVSMLLGHLLTGTAQVFADVRTYWSPEAVKRVTGQTLTGVEAGGMIHLINSGAAAVDGVGLQRNAAGEGCLKPFWEISPEEATACLGATNWYPGSRGYFRGGGFSSGFRTRAQMPMTMVRLNIVAGVGPVLQLVEGWSVDMPDAVHCVLNERTDPTWPTTWFVPRVEGNGALRDVYSVMAHWGANHGSLCYGHVGADLMTLASMLRIPVGLHNVADDRLFRPSTWDHFGTAQTQAADYQACATLGPLYR